MSVSDILKGIGDVAGALGERTAQVVSGQAPEIDAEKRQRAEKLEDEQIAAKASILENNLALGQKYGTLTPDQQQQYIDQIMSLYSHPRHAATLMEKLRKAIHPNGMYAQGPQAPLANPVPSGGTAALDEQNRERALADTLGLRQAATDEEIDRRAADAAANRKSTAKSPPLPGNQLPPDAVSPDGQPIPQEARTAEHSFVQWNGQWWPVAKPKPVMKKISGHLVLMDPTTGAKLRDLGPEDAAKVTSRQTLQPGDDGQMHLVTLTSVTTPEGAQIDVQPEESSEGAPQAGAAPQSAPPSKTSAKKVNPGSILPKTGAKPTGNSGPMVPGLSKLAHSKDPLYKSLTAQYTKAAEDANAKKLAFQNAQGLLADNNRQTDLELVYAWVRANVQGAGRMTNTEIQQTATAGSWGMRIKNATEQASTGRLAPEMEQQFFNDIKRSYENSQKEADDLKGQLDGPAPAPAPVQPKVMKFNPATGRLE